MSTTFTCGDEEVYIIKPILLKPGLKLDLDFLPKENLCVER